MGSMPGNEKCYIFCNRNARIHNYVQDTHTCYTLHVRCISSGHYGAGICFYKVQIQPAIKVSENHCLGLVGAGC